MSLKIKKASSTQPFMDDGSLTSLRRQTIEEVLPNAHGMAVVTYDLDGDDPTKWTVTLKIFARIDKICGIENNMIGNDTKH